MKKLVKYLYSFIPFKKQIFTIVRIVFKPGEKIHRHLYFNGVIRVPVKKNASFLMRHYGYELENEIFWQGLAGWEKESVSLWIKLCEQSKTILDIGANTGVFSLVAKSVNPSSKVLAFEPVERVFKKLQHNVELNNYDVVCYASGVSHYTGEAVFYDTDAEHVYTVVINKDLSQNQGYHKVSVPVITIDEVINQQQLKNVDLVKIDVERHEPEVLEGFSTIWKFKPVVLIEILDDEVGKKVEELLLKLGCSYLYFAIDEEKGLKKMNHIRQGPGYNYLLCTEEVAQRLGLLKNLHITHS